ncbi:MAG TPA: GNAT family N-acetyltransferase [Candidatus Limnocylindrales bacterium]|nr:GNAT family N-acetyltransferase [Candidatus Limnocylindrales bacterium]
MNTATDTHHAVDLPDAPAIAGLRFRPVDLAADAPGIAVVINDSAAADGNEYALTPDDIRHDLEHQAHFDLGRDVLIAEIDGRIVGEGEQNVVVREGVAVHQWNAWVHPDERGRGIGRALVRWVERRARQAAAEWPGPEPHELGTWIDSESAAGLRILESEGYRQVRYGFSMLRPLSEPIPEAALPDGLEVRPVVAADHRRIWDADTEAFRDHNDAAIRTEEDFERWFSMPNIDTSLWRVAWDGDEVVGSVMTFIWPEENEALGFSRGWLEHISVRRPWRNKGVAKALIVDTLRMLRDMGIAEGALGVDSMNPTGALQLYESLGFRRHKTGISFRKSI